MLPYKGAFQPALFEARDENYHVMIRKPIANAYSMSTVIEFEPAVDSTIALFMSKLDQYSHSEVSIDFGVWLHRYAFDVLYESSVSANFSADPSQRRDWIQ